MPIKKHGLRSNKITKNLSESEVSETEVECICAVCKEVLSPKIENEDTEGEVNNSIECEVCVRSFHTACVNVSDAKYDMLVENDFHWFCPDCDAAAKQLYKSVTALQAENMKLKQDLKVVTERIDVMEATIDTKIANSKKQIKGEIKADLTKLTNEHTKLKADVDEKITTKQMKKESNSKKN